MAILSLDKSSREASLRFFHHEMMLAQKPREFLDAVASLIDEDNSAKALELLQKELIDDPSLTESSRQQVRRIFKLLVVAPVAVFASGILGMILSTVPKHLGITSDVLPNIIAAVAFLPGSFVVGFVLAKCSWYTIILTAMCSILAVVLLAC